MFWKVVFVCLLAVGVGVLWQHEDYRKMLLSELDTARTSVNRFAGRYEGWQVIVSACALTIMASCILSFLFDDHIYSLRKRVTRFFFVLVRRIPGVKGKIHRESVKVVAAMEKQSFAPKPGETYRTELPKKGLTHNAVLKELTQLESLAKVEWEKGWVSGGLYNSSPELTKLATAVFERTVWTNPLHAGIFPQVRKMEAEVIQWTVKLFNGGEDACGVMTSGGTDSIIMAMRAYREWGYERGIKYPEIVCAVSVHSAFAKAAEYFRMKFTRVSNHAIPL